MRKKLVRKILTLMTVLITSLLILCSVNLQAQSQAQPQPQNEKSKTIGILMPMDHNALREIVAGFKEKLYEKYPEITVKVQNASGDINVQRSILQQYIHQNVDMIVPIGSQCTQMTLSMVKNQAILSLAADVVLEAQQQKVHNISGVTDEIGPEKSLDFIQKVFPSLKKMTLVYSNTEKVFPEVTIAENHAKKLGMQLQKIKIQALPDLQGLTSSLDKDSEAIFILKDHLIVSGIQTLIREANKRQVPIITSDEGSVKEGVVFAVGVKEKSIGEQGAALAIKILKAKENDAEFQVGTLPVQRIENLFVFYNPKTCVQNGISEAELRSKAKEAGYATAKVEAQS